MKTTEQSIDYREITEQQRNTWATGDFHQIARLNVTIAEALCDAAGLHAGERVLDVACGSGTAALVAARRYCEVTGIDYVPALIDRARDRAAVDGLDARFEVADAQEMPFADASFDAVLSVYGVQFAPDQQQAADQMLRVCRPGGRIALAGPLPEGWSGDFFATIAGYVPPPAGTSSALRWGTEDGVQALIGSGAVSLHSEKRAALQYFRSVDHAADVFLAYFGPAIRASAADPANSLRDDLKTVFDRYNRATDGTAVIENSYMLTVAARA